MNLPYNWDFIQDNIPPEKLAENWNAFYWSIPSRTNTAVCKWILQLGFFAPQPYFLTLITFFIPLL
jgi:hypothetical protein